MADNYPSGYSAILDSMRRDYVRTPDGSYKPFPSRGQPTSLEEIYRGILPQQQSGLASRKVNTVPIDPTTGNPLAAGFRSPTMASYRAAEEEGGYLPYDPQRSGSRSAITQGVQQAGNVQMPPGARPASVDRAFAQMGSPMPSAPANPRGYNVLTGEYEAMQPSTPYSVGPDRDARFPVGTTVTGKNQMAFGPDAQNPALAAIDMLTGSRNSAMPRPNPFGYAAQPSRTPAGPQPMPGRPVALSRGMAAPAPTSAGIQYKVQPGDTLWSIAKDVYGSGQAATNLAKANNISNPNKIRAGQTITLGAGTPTKGPSIAQTLSSGSYTISKGDTLSKIAKANNTTVAALAKKNNISDPNKIIAGAKIKV